jgi:hypothetical protein
MQHIEKYTSALKSVFVNAKNKHEANFQSVPIMEEMSGDKKFLTEILLHHIAKKDSLNTKHYPTVGLNIELNEYYGLVANCWIPLPDRTSDVSTKAIHHHGEMLLTTATAFGHGYDHWLFTTPELVDEEKEIYSLKLINHAPHPLHHVDFVDAYIPHLPFYPPSTTITYALWSHRHTVTWKDKLKRIPIFQKNSDKMREIAVKVGLASPLDLKVVNYFDFYPTCDGFRGIKERREFERVSNDDYLWSLFHIIQETGNESLSVNIKEKLDSGENVTNPALVRELVSKLESGVSIEGKLSPNHFGVEYANFTRAAVENALIIQENGKPQCVNI